MFRTAPKTAAPPPAAPSDPVLDPPTRMARMATRTATLTPVRAGTDPRIKLHRERMLAAVSAYGSHAMICALLSGIVLLQLLPQDLHSGPILPWLGLNSAVTLLGWWLYRRIRLRRSDRRPIRSRIAIRASIGHSVVLGVVWGALPWVSAYGSDRLHLLEMGMVAVAILCIVGFALGPLPYAGNAFAILAGTGHALAILHFSVEGGIAFAGLIALFVTVIGAMSVGASKTQYARASQEVEQTRQHEVIGLLLKDFAENSSDLLWETDGQGVLVAPSPRLCSLLRIDPASARRVRLLQRFERFARTDPESRGRLTELLERFESTEPFRDHVICVHVQGRTLWWSITAKPVDALSNGLPGWRGVISDVTASRVSHNELTRMAHECSLTGLANRLRFMDVLNRSLAEASETRRVAVLLIDLDDFKRVNDTHGHNYGDGLLKTIATRLRQNLRPGDLAARLGGDEFAVLLNHVVNDEEAARLAGRMLARAQEPVTIDGLQIPVGLSIGIAVAPRDGRLAEELMRSADAALYSAKAAGKGSLRVYSQALGLQTRRKRMIEQGLRSAIANNAMYLVFQPQVSYDQRSVVGFEALARWTHPELGPIQPSEFIPVAEETGQIGSLGTWVLLESCRAAAHWPEHVGVAVNVSVAQAIDDRLIQLVSTALQETRLAPARLEIEITESLILDDNPHTMRALHALRALGVRIALDDFGVGYSSLAYLRRFPFDSLKIDRAFNGEITSNAQARAIVQAILRLASCLGMTTIAEGIEFPEQAVVLSEDGCDVMQGFYFSKPLPVSEVPQFIRRWSNHSVAKRITQILDTRDTARPFTPGGATGTAARYAAPGATGTAARYTAPDTTGTTGVPAAANGGRSRTAVPGARTATRPRLLSTDEALAAAAERLAAAASEAATLNGIDHGSAHGAWPDAHDAGGAAGFAAAAPCAAAATAYAEVPTTRTAGAANRAAAATADGGGIQ